MTPFAIIKVRYKDTREKSRLVLWYDRLLGAYPIDSGAPFL
jgi:hypothetical protein